MAKKTEEKVEDVADVLEDATEVLEDLGVISEAQEKKILALIKKYKKAILIAIPSLIAVALLIKSLV
tara:strand:- start:2932 stop:3132 length:201 start_codon:yes stop_codon:yes gene_type:complete